MRRRLRALFVALGAALAVGCASQDGSSITLVNTAGDSKADAVWGKTIEIDPASTVYLDGTEYRGVTEIVSATSNEVEVRSDMVVVAPGPDAVAEIAADTVGMLTGMTTEVRFMLFARIAGSDWEPVQMHGTVSSIFGSRDVDINFFESVILDPVNEELIFSDGVNVTEAYTAPMTGLGAGADVEWGVFVFPIENWGDPVGQFDYVINATCNGGPCVPR